MIRPIQGEGAAPGSEPVAAVAGGSRLSTRVVGFVDGGCSVSFAMGFCASSRAPRDRPWARGYRGTGSRGALALYPPLRTPALEHVTG